MLHNLLEVLQLLSQLACEDKQQMAYMANCLQMMRNLVEVLRLLSTSKPSASGAGLELLLAARGSEDGAAQLPQKQSSQAYVQREADAAWDCVQVSRQPVTFAFSPQGYSAISAAGRHQIMLPMEVRQVVYSQSCLGLLLSATQHLHLLSFSSLLEQPSCVGGRLLIG